MHWLFIHILSAGIRSGKELHLDALIQMDFGWSTYTQTISSLFPSKVLILGGCSTEGLKLIQPKPQNLEHSSLVLRGGHKSSIKPGTIVTIGDFYRSDGGTTSARRDVESKNRNCWMDCCSATKGTQFHHCLNQGSLPRHLETPGPWFSHMLYPRPYYYGSYLAWYTTTLSSLNLFCFASSHHYICTLPKQGIHD